MEYDGHALTDLARDFQLAGAQLDREAIPAALTKIGHEVEDRAKTIAADAGSTSIPPGISGNLQTKREYRIQASGIVAMLWEHGNKGRSVDDPTFEHPTFGHAPEVEQPRHPFLRPAWKQIRPVAVVEVEKAANVTLSEHRL